MWRRKPSPRTSYASRPELASTSSCNMCAAAAGAASRTSESRMVRIDPDVSLPTLRNAAKSCVPSSSACRRVHRLAIERLRNVPHERALERAGERGVADQIPVGLRPGVEPGVEARRRVLHAQDAHVGRKLRIERARQRLRCRDRRSRDTLATCPSACTPASVRPAPCTVTGAPSKRASASSSSACTESPSACRCQPTSRVPS